MAGDWIKIEESMPEKPEVAMIADELGIEDPDTVAGKLIRVWAWATRNCNGDGVTFVTAMKQIDRCAGVTGFALAMEKAGWVAIKGRVLTFPNFGRHCSQTAKERALTGKRVAKNRAKKCNAPTVTKTLPEKRRDSDDDERGEPVIVADWIKSLRSGWRVAFSKQEKRAMADQVEVFASISDQDRATIRDYLYAKIPEGTPSWQPHIRLKFIESIGNVFGYATEWRRKQEARRPTATTAPPLKKFVPVDGDTLAEVFGEKRKATG